MSGKMSGIGPKVTGKRTRGTSFRPVGVSILAFLRTIYPSLLIDIPCCLRDALKYKSFWRPARHRLKKYVAGTHFHNANHPAGRSSV